MTFSSLSSLEQKGKKKCIKIKSGMLKRRKQNGDWVNEIYCSGFIRMSIHTRKK